MEHIKNEFWAVKFVVWVNSLGILMSEFQHFMSHLGRKSSTNTKSSKEWIWIQWSFCSYHAWMPPLGGTWRPWFRTYAGNYRATICAASNVPVVRFQTCWCWGNFFLALLVLKQNILAAVLSPYLTLIFVFSIYLKIITLLVVFKFAQLKIIQLYFSLLLYCSLIQEPCML